MLCIFAGLSLVAEGRETAFMGPSVSTNLTAFNDTAHGEEKNLAVSVNKNKERTFRLLPRFASFTSSSYATVEPAGAVTGSRPFLKLETVGQEDTKRRNRRLPERGHRHMHPDGDSGDAGASPPFQERRRYNNFYSHAPQRPGAPDAARVMMRSKAKSKKGAKKSKKGAKSSSEVSDRIRQNPLFGRKNEQGGGGGGGLLGRIGRMPGGGGNMPSPPPMQAGGGGAGGGAGGGRMPGGGGGGGGMGSKMGKSKKGKSKKGKSKKGAKSKKGSKH
jgi:hypothetical protein